MSAFGFGEHCPEHGYRVLDERVMRASASIMLLLGLSLAIFSLSLFLLGNEAFFGPACMLCLVSLALLCLETAFGICIGCKLYGLGLRLKLIISPQVAPNCMGDSCKVN